MGLMKPTVVVAVLILGFLNPHQAAAVKFERIAPDHFKVTQVVTYSDHERSAIKRKAASVCVGAGYEFAEVVGSERRALGLVRFEDLSSTPAVGGHTATLEIRLYRSDGGDRIRCREWAHERWVDNVVKRLRKLDQKKARRTGSGASG